MSRTVIAMPAPHRHAPTPRAYLRHQLQHFAIAIGLLGGSLALGMWGYGHYENMPWRDSFLNSAMLLGGMGPVKQDLSEDGKVFAGVYALFAGLVVISVTALLLAPSIHYMMKRVHWEDRVDPK